MATAFAVTRASSNLYLHHYRQDLYPPYPSCFSPLPSFLPRSRFQHQNIFIVATPNRLRRITVGALRPPTPPSPDPPPPRNTTDLASLAEVASTIKDRVKIFLAVLIWMSLFFWASTLQGRGGRGKGKGKKGSRFK